MESAGRVVTIHVFVTKGVYFMSDFIRYIPIEITFHCRPVQNISVGTQHIVTLLHQIHHAHSSEEVWNVNILICYSSEFKSSTI